MKKIVIAGLALSLSGCFASQKRVKALEENVKQMVFSINNNTAGIQNDVNSLYRDYSRRKNYEQELWVCPSQTSDRLTSLEKSLNKLIVVTKSSKTVEMVGEGPENRERVYDRSFIFYSSASYRNRSEDR